MIENLNFESKSRSFKKKNSKHYLTIDFNEKKRTILVIPKTDREEQGTLDSTPYNKDPRPRGEDI